MPRTANQTRSGLLILSFTRLATASVDTAETQAAKRIAGTAVKFIFQGKLVGKNADDLRREFQCIGS